MLQYPKYDPYGPRDTAGKISLCKGKIVLEPQKIPIVNKKNGNVVITQRSYISGIAVASFKDHGVVKVTINNSTAYFDIGNQSNQGNFGGHDHWWFPNDGSPDAKDFQTFMDHGKTECYVVTGAEDKGN